MITERQEEQASLYVLGALDAEEHQIFEAAARQDAELGELVRSLQRAAELVARAAPPATLPTGLKAKVLGRIPGAAVVEEPRGQRGQTADFSFIAASDPAGWKELPVRGAWIKLLSLERQRGYAVCMGKLEAGVRYPAHQHAAAEELLILTGDLHVGDRVLGPGDFHHSGAGTSHGINYSIEGCTLLAVLPVEHELVRFAMA